MKKTVTLSVLCALCLASGCATTGASSASSANTPMTLDEALQKSAETRQKILDAKQAYEDAKAASEASKENDTNFSTELAKQKVKSQLEETKAKLEAEKEAWKDVFGG